MATVPRFRPSYYHGSNQVLRGAFVLAEANENNVYRNGEEHLDY